MKDLTPGIYIYSMIIINRFDESIMLHFAIGFNDAYSKTIKELFGARGVIANWNRNSIEY